MLKVWPAAVARVAEEVKDMAAAAQKAGDKVSAIEPWDYLYYADKVRKAKYALDLDELKGYFALDSMIQASFWMAGQLYGLSFKRDHRQGAGLSPRRPRVGGEGLGGEVRRALLW
jgi:peptidyl-dipeptidase Dcp